MNVQYSKSRPLTANAEERQNLKLKHCSQREIPLWYLPTYMPMERPIRCGGGNLRACMHNYTVIQ